MGQVNNYPTYSSEKPLEYAIRGYIVSMVGVAGPAKRGTVYADTVVNQLTQILAMVKDD